MSQPRESARARSANITYEIASAMGLSDRDYARDSEPGFHLSAPTTATVQIIVVTFAVYVLQMVSPRVTDALELNWDWFRRPWEVYRLVTYGFVHSIGRTPGEPGVSHILLNMFGLWMFGRGVEERYGRTTFIAFYLAAIVFSGLVWTACQQFEGPATIVGASGGTTALAVLFALTYPHLDVLFMFAIPMKMWMVGVLFVVADLFGAVRQNGNVAFTAHLGGAAYALLFYKTRWSPAMWFTRGWQSMQQIGKPRLRVHSPDEEDELSEKVDAILEKIQQHGQDSLTWNERRILEKASRKAREKRK